MALLLDGKETCCADISTFSPLTRTKCWKPQNLTLQTTYTRDLLSTSEPFLITSLINENV